jgi:hypothetical protein
LSVAKVMSATLAGLVAVSSAMTNRPACLAWLRAALTASPLVVIRMPLSPREIALSIALIWVCVSPSLVPAATVRLTLSLAAAALASFSMLTKYGLVSVLRMRETPTLAPPPDPPEELLPEEAVVLEEEQAAIAVATHRARPAAVAVRRIRRREFGTRTVPEWFMVLRPFVTIAPRWRDNVDSTRSFLSWQTASSR